MENSVRVIPIECKFGKTSAYAYYIDAPQPALIDTGIAASASEVIEPTLAEHGFKIEDISWILLTHGHVDHLGGAHAVWEKTGRQAEVVIPKKEAELLRNRWMHITHYENLQGRYLDAATREKHKAILMKDIGPNLEPTYEVVGGENLSLGGNVTITVLSTPGHSEGQVSYILDGLEWAFAADAVQMYGGAQGGFPTIEYPTLYRQSLDYFLEVLRPKRLYLGHHFLDQNGNAVSAQIEGITVSDVLYASLEMDARLQELARRHFTDKMKSSLDDEIYGPFKFVADELGYTGNPTLLPSAFFVTMHGYRQEFINLQEEQTDTQM